VAFLFIHCATIATVAVRLRRSGPIGDGTDALPPVTVIRRVCGLENYLELTLASSFWLDYPHYEVIFCVAHESDPAVPLIRHLIAMHPNVPSRLLAGRSSVAINPKLDNIVKGWHAAKHDWIVMADSNVGLPADYLQRLFAVWDAECGLVCSPPVGALPQNFAAHLECAFLNTHQARWQCFADSIGFGFAQGKTMLWQRRMLDDCVLHRDPPPQRRWMTTTPSRFVHYSSLICTLECEAARRTRFSASCAATMRT
jgi:ceramide glucosyltransferase